MRETSPRSDIVRILAMVAAVVVPVCFTLRTVQYRPGSVPPESNPTPYGYTVSLSNFLFPLLLILGWHVRHPEHPIHRRSLALSAGAIAVLGAFLDEFFGSDFFTFRNAGATLGVRVPAWSFTRAAYIPGYLPVEEFAFYVLGGLFMIAVYSWADAEWLQVYETEEYSRLASARPRLIQLSPKTLALWLALTGVGLLFKMASGNTAGVPGYFLFLMVLGFLPTVLFIKGVSGFVNWRAFAFAYAALLLVSLLWEATLAIPYDWWNYQPRHMLGVHITAWNDLPLEAVIVWVVVAWNCVIAYEVFRVFLHMDRPIRQALFGSKATASHLAGNGESAASIGRGGMRP